MNRVMSDEMRERVMSLYRQFDQADTKYSKVFDGQHFGYRRITIERPLRVFAKVTPDIVEKIQELKGYKDLIANERTREKRKEINAVLTQLLLIPPENDEHKIAGVGLLTNLTSTLRKEILKLTTYRHEQGVIVATMRNGELKVETDSDRRSYEYVPLDMSIESYFEKEVRPYDADAWINHDEVDMLDGMTGIVGYEMNFNRYFYEPVKVRPLEEINNDLKTLYQELLSLMNDL
jgi:type I restriction enzyme M protein